MTIDLFKTRKNLYSQHGEDGILEALLDAVGLQTGYFVEFGAWDGKHWSNTYACYERGWAGCYIEGMNDRFERLCTNIPDPRVIKIKRYIAPDGPNSLDEILTAHGVARVDLLSVDIDSDDLVIWEGVRRYRPSVVIIEYNSTMPFDTHYTNPRGATHGNSALSITESAKRRGYRLVEGTDTNLIFALDDLPGLAAVHCKTLDEVRNQTFQLRYFFGNDGTLLHNYALMNDAGITEIFPIPFALSFGVQPVPRNLRKVRIRANYVALMLFVLIALIRCPLQFLKLGQTSVRKLSPDKGVWGVLGLIFDKDKVMEILKK